MNYLVSEGKIIGKLYSYKNARLDLLMCPGSLTIDFTWLKMDLHYSD